MGVAGDLRERAGVRLMWTDRSPGGVGGTERGECDQGDARNLRIEGSSAFVARIWRRSGGVTVSSVTPRPY